MHATAVAVATTVVVDELVAETITLAVLVIVTVAVTVVLGAATVMVVGLTPMQEQALEYRTAPEHGEA